MVSNESFQKTIFYQLIEIFKYYISLRGHKWFDFNNKVLFSFYLLKFLYGLRLSNLHV